MLISLPKLKIKFLLLCLFAFHQIATAGEIVQITAANRHLVPKGKEVDAIDGDWIMKNDAQANPKLVKEMEESLKKIRDNGRSRPL